MSTAEATPARPPAAAGRTSFVVRPPTTLVYAVLAAALLAVALLATTIGAAGIPLPRLFAALGFDVAAADPAMLARSKARLDSMSPRMAGTH